MYHVCLLYRETLQWHCSSFSIMQGMDIAVPELHPFYADACAQEMGAF